MPSALAAVRPTSFNASVALFRLRVPRQTLGIRHFRSAQDEPFRRTATQVGRHGQHFVGDRTRIIAGLRPDSLAVKPMQAETVSGDSWQFAGDVIVAEPLGNVTQVLVQMWP